MKYRAPVVDMCDPSGNFTVSSGQATHRHIRNPTYGCFLPNLTGFIGTHCGGPSRQHLV